MLTHYESKKIIEKVQPSYYRVLKPVVNGFKPLRVINNLVLSKTTGGQFSVTTPEDTTTLFPTKEGAIEFMAEYKKYATQTGKGYKLSLDENDLKRIINIFNDTDCIGITAKRILKIL
jgi:hypothetical protein